MAYYELQERDELLDDQKDRDALRYVEYVLERACQLVGLSRGVQCIEFIVETYWEKNIRKSPPAE